MFELSLKAGGKIYYTSGMGRRFAEIKSITISPTAKPNHSIAWLNLIVPAQGGAKYSTDVSIPADSGSLKAFKVEMA